MEGRHAQRDHFDRRRIYLRSEEYTDIPTGDNRQRTNWREQRPRDPQGYACPPVVSSQVSVEGNALQYDDSHHTDLSYCTPSPWKNIRRRILNERRVQNDRFYKENCDRPDRFYEENCDGPCKGLFRPQQHFYQRNFCNRGGSQLRRGANRTFRQQSLQNDQRDNDTINNQRGERRPGGGRDTNISGYRRSDVFNAPSTQKLKRSFPNPKSSVDQSDSKRHKIDPHRKDDRHGKTGDRHWNRHRDERSDRHRHVRSGRRRRTNGDIADKRIDEIESSQGRQAGEACGVVESAPVQPVAQADEDPYSVVEYVPVHPADRVDQYPCDQADDKNPYGVVKSAPVDNANRAGDRACLAPQPHITSPNSGRKEMDSQTNQMEVSTTDDKKSQHSRHGRDKKMKGKDVSQILTLYHGNQDSGWSVINRRCENNLTCRPTEPPAKEVSVIVPLLDIKTASRSRGKNIGMLLSAHTKSQKDTELSGKVPVIVLGREDCRKRAWLISENRKSTGLFEGASDLKSDSHRSCSSSSPDSVHTDICVTHKQPSTSNPNTPAAETCGSTCFENETELAVSAISNVASPPESDNRHQMGSEYSSLPTLECAGQTEPASSDREAIEEVSATMTSPPHPDRPTEDLANSQYLSDTEGSPITFDASFPIGYTENLRVFTETQLGKVVSPSTFNRSENEEIPVTDTISTCVEGGET